MDGSFSIYVRQSLGWLCFSNLIFLGNSPVAASYYGILADAGSGAYTINRILVQNVEFYSQFIGIGIFGNADYWDINDNSFDVWLNTQDSAASCGSIGCPAGIYQLGANKDHFGGNSIRNNLIVLNVDSANPPPAGSTTSYGIYISSINAPSNTISGNYIQCIGCGATTRDDFAEEGIYFSGWASLIERNTLDSFSNGLQLPLSASINYIQYNLFLANYNHGIMVQNPACQQNQIPANQIFNNNITRTGYFGSGGTNPSGLFLDECTATSVNKNELTNTSPDIVNDSEGTAFGINNYKVCQGTVGC